MVQVQSAFVYSPKCHPHAGIDPNTPKSPCTGKSNLMDAISFVLGVKSKELRSVQLKELLYHSGLTQEGEAPAKRAHVMAVYETGDGEELQFMRA